MINRFIALAGLAAALVTPAIVSAEHPRGIAYWPRIELFDWVETLERPSYRERYNRPRYIGGKIAALIAPSSQEAMSWHEHKRRGSYHKHAGPVVVNYLYPKPWEALPIEARRASAN